MEYTGRFAPSPTGPLHAGSLVSAVASFLHARQAGGRWLVRIEDIDPPREKPGAADVILRTLEALRLEWDGEVLFQSRRLAAYDALAFGLIDRGLAYWCTCSRSDLRALGPAVGYPGTCRERRTPVSDAAIRVRVDHPWPTFTDALQGEVRLAQPECYGDFVIRRRDGLPAYHLAVTADDAEQGVTTVVRGADLLEAVPPQRHLAELLHLRAVDYYHVPIIVNRDGQKLSKQTGAPPVDVSNAAAARRTACEVLTRLGARPPPALVGADPAELWAWAVDGWRIESLRGVERRSESGEEC